MQIDIEAEKKEIRALKTVINSNLKIEMQDVYEYLLIGHMSSSRTGITEISAVLPGQLIVISQGVKKYDDFWSFECKKVSSDLIKGELEKAITDRTYEQRNPALSMSGGLDSTTNAIIMKNLGIDFKG